LPQQQHSGPNEALPQKHKQRAASR